MSRVKRLSNRPYLSVIVPAYKCEKSISLSLQSLQTTLENMNLSYEIVCVVDGFLDKTFENAKKLASSKIKVIGYPRNQGKGYTVRYGMSRAKGEIIGFTDAGDLNYSALPLMLEHFKWYNADIILGSKRHPVSKVIYPWQRRIISWGYQILVRLLFGLNVRDTQVGMKFYKRKVIQKILPRLLVKEFAFDIETLAVSYYLGFKKIYEAPVQLKLDFSKKSSTVSKGFIRVVFRVFWDTLAFFYRLRILNYYADSNRKNWPNEV